jgi:putative endonuclease
VSVSAPILGVGAGGYGRPMDVRPVTGRRGEDAAELLYVRRGYRVVARNWRCRIGELDLVLVRGDTLVVCEVKTRRGARFGAGYESVNAHKRQKVRAVAEVYVLQRLMHPHEIRFDVASVFVRPDGSALVEVFEDAFR